MSDTKLKMLKEVFKDFEVNNNIINTKIESINLYKKTNKLEVNILSDKPIKVKAVGYFERYLVKRFMLKEAVIHVKYIEDISQDFTKEWEDILDYLSYKHPLTKALLRDSEILVEDNIININLKLSGERICEFISEVSEKIRRPRVRKSEAFSNLLPERCNNFIM